MTIRTRRRNIMMSKGKRTIATLLRFAPFALCLVFVLIYLFSGKDVTAESLRDYAPEEPFLAALFMIALYAFKSLSIFFPVIVLHIAAGFLFSPAYALAVNAVGMLVELAIPYWVGRAAGSSHADRLIKKYPRLGEVMSYQQGNCFFTTFFLRVISCLPGDIVSMYFGANRIAFGTYMLGSFLGILPGLVCATFLGTNITNISSPMFWVSVSLTVGISVGSFLLYFFWKRAKKK